MSVVLRKTFGEGALNEGGKIVPARDGAAVLLTLRLATPTGAAWLVEYDNARVRAIADCPVVPRAVGAVGDRVLAAGPCVGSRPDGGPRASAIAVLDPPYVRWRVQDLQLELDDVGVAFSDDESCLLVGVAGALVHVIRVWRDRAGARLHTSVVEGHQLATRVAGAYAPGIDGDLWLAVGRGLGVGGSYQLRSGRLDEVAGLVAESWDVSLVPFGGGVMALGSPLSATPNGLIVQICENTDPRWRPPFRPGAAVGRAVPSRVRRDLIATADVDGPSAEISSISVTRDGAGSGVRIQRIGEIHGLMSVAAVARETLLALVMDRSPGAPRRFELLDLLGDGAGYG